MLPSNMQETLTFLKLCKLEECNSYILSKYEVLFYLFKRYRPILRQASDSG
jgi:hypothetical protein